MDPNHPLLPQIPSNSSFLEAQTTFQPALDGHFFTSLWDHTSPVLGSPQQVATYSTAPFASTSIPSTFPSLPSTSRSPSNYIQHATIPAPTIHPQGSAPVPVSLPYSLGEKPKKAPRPPNAFLLFRSWLISNGDLPPEVLGHQQIISKVAGKAWRLLDPAIREVWQKRAILRSQDHERNLADNKSERSIKKPRAPLRKAKKVVRVSEEEAPKAQSDVHAHDHRASGTKRPRRERPSPYSFQAPECTARAPAGEYQAPHSFSSAQTGSSSGPSLINFDLPPTFLAQPLSPLPLHPQLPTHAQETPQHHLPLTFLPPALPNHFEKAYEKEDGTVVFSDNYAPINPFSPPSGYYAGTFSTTNAGDLTTAPSINTAAEILGLYELHHTYDPFNSNLGGSNNGFPICQPPGAANEPFTLSAAPLTAREQEVFNTTFKHPRTPFTLEDVVTSPPSPPDEPFASFLTSGVRPCHSATPSPSFPYYSFSPAEEVSFAPNGAWTMSQPPPPHQCA